MNPKYISSISELDNIVGLAPRERENMETVTDLFPFRANDYYLSLINWKDGHDPLRMIVIPDSRELKSGGSTDPPCEKNYTKTFGLQHKYHQISLLLLTDACTGLAKRARFIMSHATSKIEMVGKTAMHVFMRYHQLADPADTGTFMIFRHNLMACQFDYYRHPIVRDDELLPVKTPKNAGCSDVESGHDR